MPLDDTISVTRLFERIGTDRMPIVLDVRRADVFDTSEDVVPLSRRDGHLTPPLRTPIDRPRRASSASAATATT
jgi:hypothetical protein